MSLLPDRPRVQLAHAPSRLSLPAIAALDALLLIVPAKPAAGVWRELPHGALLRRQFRLTARNAGTAFACTLPGPRQTLAVIGVAAATDDMFRTLSLAGQMTRLAASVAPRQIGVAATDSTARMAALDALLSAVLAAASPPAQFRSRSAAAWQPARITLFGGKPEISTTTRAIEDGASLSRWLTGLPGNHLTPGIYRERIAALARQQGWRMRVFDEKALRRAKAGAFLSVTQGSAARDAAIVQLQYRPRRNDRRTPIALVGKGICFDTGGTNLKTHKSMLDMHTDMAGSAVVLGTLQALTDSNYPAPVDAWVALAENRIGASASKPQDVVTAANGTTIQIIHTDAEGRMVLADTLALASRTRPRLVMDFATLTGACVYALTERYSGVFTNRLDLRLQIEAVGTRSGERVWCFPLDADFDQEIDSKVADVMQCPIDGKGDHIYAARFLSRFVGATTPWLHVDLSAAVRAGGLAHVATDITGFGVRYAAALLQDAALLAALERAPPSRHIS